MAALLKVCGDLEPEVRWVDRQRVALLLRWRETWLAAEVVHADSFASSDDVATRWWGHLVTERLLPDGRIVVVDVHPYRFRRMEPLPVPLDVANRMAQVAFRTGCAHLRLLDPVSPVESPTPAASSQTGVGVATPGLSVESTWGSLPAGVASSPPLSSYRRRAAEQTLEEALATLPFVRAGG
jgi:hypothetical protein